MRRAWDEVSYMALMSEQQLWSPYTLPDKGLLYTDENTQINMNPRYWLPGKPKNLPCVLYNRDGYSDQLCTAENQFICYNENPTYLHLRGLCDHSEIDRSYVLSFQENALVWIGAFKTVISYNTLKQRWEAFVQGSEVWAATNASYEGLLLGAHNWTIYNDRQCNSESFYDSILSMNSCTSYQFNCNDGGCIPLEYWCDNNFLNNSISCEDGSDELNCTYLHDLTGYNKNVIPIPNPFTELDFFIEILNIQDISALKRRIRVSFNLSMAWEEPRASFHGLWIEKSFNQINHAEQKLLWKPSIVFSNIILKELELLTKTEMIADCDLLLNYSQPDLSVLYNHYMYRNCSIFSTTVIR